MADQVEGMRRQGITSCVTINGMLSLPERHEALNQVRLGDAAMLDHFEQVYWSPTAADHAAIKPAPAQIDVAARMRGMWGVNVNGTSGVAGQIWQRVFSTLICRLGRQIGTQHDNSCSC